MSATAYYDYTDADLERRADRWTAEPGDPDYEVSDYDGSDEHRPVPPVTCRKGCGWPYPPAAIAAHEATCQGGTR
jgi:hypothetical protein